MQWKKLAHSDQVNGHDLSLQGNSRNIVDGTEGVG
jgi:hypothetical protein